MGNAGQLAVDLLVSHGACKAGYLEEPHVLPCVGNDPFGPSADGDLAVALEGMSEMLRTICFRILRFVLTYLVGTCAPLEELNN